MYSEDRLYIVPIKTPGELYDSLSDEQIVKAHFFLQNLLEEHRCELQNVCFLDEKNPEFVLTFDMLLDVYGETIKRIVSPRAHGPVLKHWAKTE